MSEGSKLPPSTTTDGVAGRGHLLFSPLSGERLSERQVLALGFSRESLQRQRPIPESVGRECLRPTPGGAAWALLPATEGPAWFPVEWMEG